MPNDLTVRVSVVNPQGEPLGGAVDLEFKPSAAGNPISSKNQDASKDIDVNDLQRGAKYQLTVTVAGGSPVSQTMTIPASGFAPIKVVIDRGAQERPPSHSLQGSLLFDHGLPAPGITVRLYAIEFGGKNVSIAETKSD